MCFNWKNLGRIAAIAVFCLLGAFAAQSFAQEREESSVLVEQPAAPAGEQPASDAADESMPGPKTTEAAALPAPPTAYHASRSARRMFRCQDEVELVMVTKNPADCCLYEICLCVPACCTGQPVVAEKRGLGGRGVVEYCWECGFTATVKFRHRVGDVKVEYDA